MTKVIYIEGMSCNHCKAAVEKALKEIRGVKSAEVDLVKKCAAVETSEDIADETFTEAIEDAGYEVTLIK